MTYTDPQGYMLLPLEKYSKAEMSILVEPIIDKEKKQLRIPISKNSAFVEMILGKVLSDIDYIKWLTLRVKM